MITCIFGLTACGVQKENMSFDQAEVESISQSVYSNVCMENAEAALQQIEAMDDDELTQLAALFKQYGLKIQGDVLAAGITSYLSSTEELGQLSDIEKYDIVADKDSLDVKMIVKGEKHDAELEILFDEKMNITSVVVNAQYSFAEKMEKAALNTLMGMGTVFVVLILISLIISCFTFIPKIQSAFSKKKEDVKSIAVDNTIAQIIENEELSDDSELVAVIAAAIAASEGSASTDGFVVRSIRRANTNKWAR